MDGWMARVFNAPCRLFLMHTSAVDTLVDRGGKEGSERASERRPVVGEEEGEDNRSSSRWGRGVGWLAGWMDGVETVLSIGAFCSWLRATPDCELT